MNLHLLFVFCGMIIRVKSECDSPFGFLGSLVPEYFSENCSSFENFNTNDNITKDDKDFNSTRIDLSADTNDSVGVFSLSDIGRSFSKALEDLTTFLKEELDGMFSLNHEIDVHKQLKNDTEIFVKTFALTPLSNDKKDKIDEVPIEIVKNNFTEFNDNFEALKEDIEKTIEAELEAYISKISINDKLDWEYVTQTLNKASTEKASSGIKEAGTKTSEVVTVIDTIPVTISEKDSANVTLNIAPLEIKENGTNFVSNNVTTEANKTIIPEESSIANISDIYSVGVRFGQDVETSTEAEMSRNTEILKKITEQVDDSNASSSIMLATTKTSEEATPATIVTKISTFKMGPTYLPTPKPTKSVTKTEQLNNDEHMKLETQTKSPVDFKLLENVKINEIAKEDESYYDALEDNATDYPIIDYIDLYKDTTNEDIEYVPTEVTANFNDVDKKTDLDNIIPNESRLSNELDNSSYINDTRNPISIFPWIASIFIRSETNNQFDYYCDGILLSHSHVLTAGRCLTSSNASVKAEDVLVFLGKRSLQSTGEGETILRVKRLTFHENFTSAGVTDDLAVLEMEEPVVFSDRIQAACLADDEGTGPGVTTAWAASLSIVNFLKKNKPCEKNPTENTFCATFADAIALCPSYGGVYASYNGDWCANGIRTGDPATRGFCIDKTVTFTDLSKYKTWIEDMLTL